MISSSPRFVTEQEAFSRQALGVMPNSSSPSSQLSSPNVDQGTLVRHNDDLGIMTEERRQQRQPRLDIDVLPIPADQRAQHERMADVMYAGLASERLTVQAVGPAEPVELVPDGPFVQSGAGVGDQEARILRAWAKLIADAGVGADRCGRGRVKRNLAGPSVLGVADGEPLLGQLYVRAVEPDHLADAHAGHGKQPDQRLVGRGLQR